MWLVFCVCSVLFHRAVEPVEHAVFDRVLVRHSAEGSIQSVVHTLLHLVSPVPYVKAPRVKAGVQEFLCVIVSPCLLFSLRTRFSV